MLLSILSYLLILQLRLQLLVVLDLAARLHEVLLHAVVPVLADGEHARLRAHVTQVCAVELLADLGQGFKVHFSLGGDGLRVDLQDLLASSLVGQRNFNFSVESAWSQQGGVEDIGPVCGHNHLDASQFVEAVELIEQLHERPLHFAVGRVSLAEPPSADGIDLVHEDNAGFVVSGISEHLSDHSRGLSDVFVDDGRSHHFQELGLDVGGECPCDEGLSCSWWAVHEASFGWLDADSLEQLGVGEWQLDGLPQHSQLVAQSSDVRKVHFPWVFAHHVEDHGVYFSGQHPHDGEGGLVQRHSRPHHQLRPVDLHLHSHNIAGTARSLYDICITNCVHFSVFSSFNTSPIIWPTD